ncbi:MAG: hybrid sensor histidine kinase/response regulator [Bacteroidales bacterium]|jgi:signal transduction histidine kinase/CheY-like chemotaxis protein|nr:hybrid sensor histidine kinase/response regulator [Bacteroidales bacterium]
MKPKIIKVFEKNIKTKLALVYVTIALMCIGFFLLTNSLFSDLKNHKERYLHSTQILVETNNLVSQFYIIQEFGNLFLVQKDLRYLNMYKAKIDTFQQKLEHVSQYIQHDDINTYLTNLSNLLHEKKTMLKKLKQLFDNKKEVDSLYNKIAERYEREMENSLPFTKISEASFSDTVWQKQLTFGQRLKEAFRSNKKREKSISSINTLATIDTLSKTTFVVASLLDSLQELSQRYQHKHTLKIKKIESELFALLTADQHITKDITTLLLRLHEELLLNVISLGDEFEAKSQKVLKKAVFLGTFALLLITALIIFIIRNVRTIRKIHEILSLEKQKTEELMESRHKLLLAISHDIKTPLNALLGYLELWEDESLPQKQLQELNTMQYSGKYILALLNNLLEFSRLEQNKTQITKENIEIVPFVMEIMEMFQPLCYEKNNKLSYNFDVNQNPQIVIDSLKLKQILVNLISNAVKYTNKGEINLLIEEICKPFLQLRITVSDTGRGIPKEKLTTLFEPFTRIEKNCSGIEGSGLGLFVVKGLVDVLGGSISIETEENQGTAVTFSIPFENVLEHTKPIVNNHKSLKIWVIDDDTTQIQIIVAMLEKLGHTAITSATKEEFENQIYILGAYYNTPTDKNPIDIVFTDLEMGDLNGYDVLHKIKSRFDIPVVCLSGNSTNSKAKLQQIGFDDFLGKPFSLLQLEKILVNIHKRRTDTSIELFSLDSLHEMFGNDTITIFELMNTFANSLPSDIQSFENALAKKDLVLVQQTAHKILPFCKQINVTSVLQTLEKLNALKRCSNIYFDNYKEDILHGVIALNLLLTALQNYLKKTNHIA